jgi:hypothetical protein
MYQFLNHNLSELNLKDTHSRIIRRRLQINKIIDTQNKFYFMLRRIYFHSSITFLLEQIEAQSHFQKSLYVSLWYAIAQNIRRECLQQNPDGTFAIQIVYKDRLSLP